VAVLIVAAIVGCNVFFAAIEFDGGMVENATAAGVEAPTEYLYVEKVVRRYAAFA
jgi:hypothetical protein